MGREGKATLFFSVMFAAAQGGNPETDKTTGEANTAQHRKQTMPGKKSGLSSSKSCGLADSRATLQRSFLSLSPPPFSL